MVMGTSETLALVIGEQIQSGFFYFQKVIFLLFGIFVLGYFSWKSKIKRENKK